MNPPSSIPFWTSSPFLKKKEQGKRLDFIESLETRSQNQLSTPDDDDQKSFEFGFSRSVSGNSTAIRPFKWGECSPELFTSPLSRSGQSQDMNNEEPNPEMEKKYLNLIQVEEEVSYVTPGFLNPDISFRSSNSMHSTSSFIQYSQDLVSLDSSQKQVLEYQMKDGVQTITQQTLIDRIKFDETSDSPDKLLLIDCRHKFEFDGGHIRNALNIQNPRDVETLLFNPDVHYSEQPIVFYCEFSLKRSPNVWNYTRACDRRLNAYPQLYYPSIYVLENGYQSFFETHGNYCEGNYTPMKSPEHQTIYKQEKVLLRKWWKEIKDAHKAKNRARRHTQE